MKPLARFISLSILGASITAMALAEGPANLDGVTMGLRDDSLRQQVRALSLPIEQEIQAYMLERGDITQRQIDRRAARREHMRREIKSLIDAGDRVAIQEKRMQLRAMRARQRAWLKQYLADNEELRLRVQAIRNANAQERERIKQAIRERRQARQDQANL